MASFKVASSIALLLCLNLVLFTLVSANSCAPSKPKPKPKPSPKPAPVMPKPGPSGSQGSCPKDTLKFGVCADLLKGLVSVVVGTPPDTPCCALIQGLTDLEVAICLCTALKAKVLGINVNASVSLTVLLNHCGKKCPKDFQCA